jgi:protein-disulfide isomerase/uncharacterized membrane protein
MHATSGVRWRALAVLSAILGAGISSYLLVVYSTGQPGLCLTGSGCDEVRASAFAYPFGIPMPLFGVLFYGMAAWLAYRSSDAWPRSLRLPASPLLAAGLVGFVFMALLTAIEVFVIEAFCTWCLASAGASTGLLVGAICAYRTGADVAEKARSSRARQQLARADAASRASLRRVTRFGGLMTGTLVSLLLVGGAIGSGPGARLVGGDRLAPGGSPRLGNGSVTVVEFADFQCPACAVVAPMLQQLATSDEVTLVYRHFPLTSIHANADAAARAAEASKLQGAFYAMGEALYASQSAWSDAPRPEADAHFAAVAARLGLDVDRWRADYGSAAVRQAVAADVGTATELGLNGTPTIFIDGSLYEGELSLTGLRQPLAAARARGQGN